MAEHSQDAWNSLSAWHHPNLRWECSGDLVGHQAKPVHNTSLFFVRQEPCWPVTVGLLLCFTFQCLILGL